jgi:murein L,D-transpeptidase YcbB/YkuD
VLDDPNAGGQRPPARKLLASGCLAAALALAVLPAEAIAYPASASPDVVAAIKSQAKSDRDTKAFYRTTSHRPIWIRGSRIGPEAERLLDLVMSADLDGLDPDNYNPRRLIEALERAESGSPKALAKAEVLLSRTFAEYARDMRRPRDVGMVVLDRELTPAAPSELQLLQAAAAAPSLDDHLQGMRWMNPLYAQLRRGLGAYSGKSDDLPQVHVPEGPPLKLGSSGERVRMLRERLGLPDGNMFDRSVARALAAFQAEQGLPQDAVAGPRTLAVLNAGLNAYPAGREQLVRLNLERARVLPPAGRRQIVVDAASARLWLYEDGRVRDTMKVIVGKPTEQTPMLAGLMRYAVVNPYWNVPPDLVQVRIAPNVLKQGPSYLRSMGYEVLSDWTEGAKVVDPKKVDWAAVASGRTEIRVRQRPGRDNMMGKMKFMMPNDLGIYLHDTPDKKLFQSADRRFSSGCVRLEDAPRLARWLFGKVPTAPSGLAEQKVHLAEPVPVYITYLTAAPAARGIAFHKDAYNRDRAQMARIGSLGDAGAP